MRGNAALVLVLLIPTTGFAWEHLESASRGNSPQSLRQPRVQWFCLSSTDEYGEYLGLIGWGECNGKTMETS